MHAINWLICLLLSLAKPSTAVYEPYPKVAEDDFFLPGDINLSVIMDYMWGKKEGRLCYYWDPGQHQAANAMIYRIKEINEDQSILPNINLGIVIQNDCWDESTSVYRTTKLLPVEGCTWDCCQQTRPNATSPSAKGCYNVIASLISYKSSIAMPTSRMLSMYKIPQLSFRATADDLSNRDAYEYFNRFVPPDSHQVSAIVDIMLTFNFSYVSLISTPTLYSRNGMTALRSLLKKHGICVAYTVELLKDFVDDDYDEVVRRLRHNHKAKVVVGFVENFYPILEAIARADAQGEFIFMLGDGSWFNRKGKWEGEDERHKAAAGINGFKIWFKQNEGEDKVYQPWIDHYENLSPWNWRNGELGIFERQKPKYLDCTFNITKGQNDSCHNYEKNTDLPYYRLRTNYKEYLDGIQVFVLAIEKLIKDNCPGAFEDRSLLNGCVTGEALLPYIRNVTFTGYDFHVRFDDIGDGIVDYDIKQYQITEDGKFSHISVGAWYLGEKRLELDMDKIKFFDINISQILGESETVPESVCAKPCEVGEFFIQGEVKCCWQCRRCRSNEKVREDNQGCTICPILTWPEQTNFTNCEAISPTYMQWLDPLALGLVGISGVGLLTTLWISYIFYKHRSKKVVKGSSIEQMIIIIIALFLSYTTAILLVAKPVYILCLVQFYSFHLSCTMTFVPLLLKTTRLYRIFAAAEKCQQVVRFVSAQALGIMGFILIGLVVAAMVACTILFTLGDALQMPVITEKFVELVCQISNETLLIPLSYNLLLLLLCSVFGFLTRKLPDNFNESWYIFISVSTTLFVWLAFLPTYSMAFYAYHKSALLGLALILNAAVTAVCLFAPKIYALYYISEDSIKVTNFQGASSAGGGGKG